MEKHIHFVASYVCVQSFLSLYDKSVCNIVVCSHNADLKLFLEEILRETCHLILPLESGKNTDYYKFKSYRQAKIALEDNRSAFSGASELYLYNNTHTLNYFIMIRLLESDSEVYYVDCSLISRDEGLTGWRGCFYYTLNKAATFYYGINLKLRKVEGKYRPLLLHDYTSIHVNSISWGEIKEKFQYSYHAASDDIDGRTKVLYVHQNFIGNGRGIDYRETAENVFSFLNKLKESGSLVYLKNHPKSEDALFRTLCDLVGVEYIIPEHIPVEMVGDEFDEIYTYFSTGVKQFVSKSRCFTLYNHIVFTKPDEAVLNFISDNLSGIEFV